MLVNDTHTHTPSVASASHENFKVDSVTFLVTVNDTWYPDEYNKTCMATVKTPALQPGVKYNETMQIHVGDCDHGPLMFTLSDDGKLNCINKYADQIISLVKFRDCGSAYGYNDSLVSRLPDKFSMYKCATLKS